MNIKQLENQCKYEEYASNYLNLVNNSFLAFSKDMLFRNFILEIDNLLSFYRYLTEETIFHLTDFHLNAYTLIGLNEHQQLVFIKPESDYNALIYHKCIESLYLNENEIFIVRLKGHQLR